MIAGIDSDGTFKVETIDFFLPSVALAEKGVRRFDWTVDEALATDRPRVILSGEVEVVKRAFQGGESPIRRSAALGDRGCKPCRTVDQSTQWRLPRR